MSIIARVVATTAATALAITTVTVAPPVAAADLNRAPLSSLVGSTTYRVDGPLGIARDKAGLLYVANWSTDAILVFARGATSDDEPVRVITGPATGLDGPSDVAVGADGSVYVANQLGDDITVYGPTGVSGGNQAPARTITAGAALDGVSTIEVDADGGIYVTAWEADTLVYFGPTASGVSDPDRMIAGANTNIRSPTSLLRRADGTLLVGGTLGTVLQFAGTDNGNVAPDRVLGGLVADLGVVSGIAEDARGNLYAASRDADVVKVFAKGAVGNAAPLAVLKGDATLLAQPWGLLIDAQGRLTTAQFDTDAIRTYAPLVAPPSVPPKVPPKPTPAVKPPAKVRALKVTSKAAAKKRRITWRAPSSNGGAKVTAYRVIVKKGKKTLVAKTVSASRRSLVVKRSKLRNGKVTVTVRARNAKGYGPAVKKAFRVRT